MKRFLLCAATLVITPLVLSAEETQEDKIVLPEITTTVSGDSLVAGKEAVPDFSDLLPSSKNGAPLPKLPGVKSGVPEEEPVADFSVLSEKNLYAEGLIGAGLPGYFAGDFSIYKTSGSEPFSLDFSHHSQDGFGRHSAVNGYFTSETKLSGKKTFAWDKITLKMEGLYDSSKYGLQEKSTAFHDLSNRTVSGGAELEWKLPHHFYAGTSFGIEWYSRYGSKVKDSAASLLPQEKDTDITQLVPALYAGWKDYGVDIKFSAVYLHEAMWAADAQYDTSSGEKVLTYPADNTFGVQRFNAGLSVDWKYSFFELGVSGGVVAGNAIGDNGAVPVFCVKTKMDFNIGEAGLPLSIKLAGGLDSYHKTCSEFEKNFLFTTQPFLFQESTDWFAKINMNIPLGKRFVLDAGTEFRKTAFSNGVWEADYSNAAATELYSAECISRTILASNAKLSFVWKIFTVDFTWENNLIHVPSNECSNRFGVNLNFQSEDAKWGFNAGAFEETGDADDWWPVINAGVFYKVRDSIRLACEIDDAVKLISGSDRDYGKTVYIKKAGSAKVLVRFFF